MHWSHVIFMLMFTWALSLFAVLMPTNAGIDDKTQYLTKKLVRID